MKLLRHIFLCLSALMLAFSCGKPASPQMTLLVPQIISTEVLPGMDAVTLHASVSGPANLTGCGFGIVKDGLIREFEGKMDLSEMSFSATPSGLDPETEYDFYAFIANGTSRIQTPPRQFKTLSPAPVDGPVSATVSFSEVSAVAGVSSVILSATMTETTDITGCGFSISADGINYKDYSSDSDGGGFTLTLDGLSPDTEYSFSAWAVQREQRVSSEVKVFRTEKEIHNVSFVSVSAVPEVFSAVLEAKVDDGTYVEYCGFGLSRAGKTAVEYTSYVSGNEFTVKVEDLLPDTDYYYYAFVLVDGSRVTSNFYVFHTLEDPAVGIMDIGAVADETRVALSARLTRTEGVISAGFAIAGDGEAFVEKAGTLEADGRLSLTWTSLQASAHYRFYVWADTDEGRTVSETLEFYTKTPVGPVSFVEVSATPDGTSVALKAVLSGIEGVEEAGFGLSENQYEYIEYSAAIGSDGFTKTVSGLKSGTKYYYYAFFTIGGAYKQSETYSFTIP